jgi:GNAT superfamily N-acetyltransferase
MNSDLAWQLTGSDPKRNIRFWYAGNELVAYGWFQPPANLIFDCLESVVGAVVPEIIDWATDRREEFPNGTMPFLAGTDMDGWASGLEDIDMHSASDQKVLVASAFEGSTSAYVLESLGFKASSHFEPHMYLRLDELPLPEVADLKVESVATSEYEAYAAAHRDAWGSGSSFSPATIEAVSIVGDIFDPQLCMAAKSDKEFAATTIFWCDPVSRLSNTEPFGVRPAFCGQGVGQKLIVERLRTLEAQVEACRVYTAGFNHQAQKLYRGCGFKDVGVSRTFTL